MNKVYRMARKKRRAVAFAAFLAGAWSAIPILIIIVAMAAVFRWLNQ